MDSNETSSPSRQIAKAVQRVLDEGGIAALATLMAQPGNSGAKILVEAAGARTGTLGDERLDSAVTEFAKRFLAARDAARTFSIIEFAPQLNEWAEANILFERIEPEPHIVICGAGHVGAALAQLAALLGYRTTLIDDRAEFVTRERFPQETIALVAAINWTEAVRAAIGNGRGVSVAVVTRGHNEDEECMHAVIGTKPDYIGLIGSKRRTNIVLDRLRQVGADEEQLRQVHAPVGLDIGAVTPEEVALAILSEIVLERRGGKGSSLSAWRRT